MKNIQLVDKQQYDIVIVGAGIIGLTCAFEYLKKYPKHSLIILEKESNIFPHQSGRNSGVIHSGIYYPPGSLKAKNCIDGYKKMLSFLEKYKIPYELTGKLIVTPDPNRLKDLEKLKKNGELNGLTGLKILSKQEILKYEPFCTNAAWALYVPQTGIVDYRNVGDKLLSEIEKKGGAVTFNSEVIELISKSSEVMLRLKGKKAVFAKKVIVASGIQSDVFISPNFKKLYRIFPFKGEYFKLKPKKNYLVKGLIYPLPDLNFPFLGVHLTKTMKASVEAGPNAILSLSRFNYSKLGINFKDFFNIISWKGFWIFSIKYWRIGFFELFRSYSKKAFLRSLQQLVPSLSLDDIERSAPGIRAQILTKDGSLYDDFLIENKENIVCIVNAPSPAATSSLSIATTIIKNI